MDAAVAAPRGPPNMRTGGDDIAQAFALMGIKPIWAPGSQRVIDFEVIPTMLLKRPRVDVTLRVSGFFRDAFPNVMRLVDAAVIKLAELEERYIHQLTHASTLDDTRSITAVVGDFKGLGNVDDAFKWIADILWSNGRHIPRTTM